MASDEFMSSECLDLDPFRVRQDLCRVAQINRKALERITNNKNEWA